MTKLPDSERPSNKAEDQPPSIAHDAESRGTAQLPTSVPHDLLPVEHYEALLKHVRSAVIRFDPDGLITYANDHAREIFGYTSEDLENRPMVGTIVPDGESTGRNLKAFIRDLIQRPDEYVIHENENLRADGERIWMSWTNKALKGPDGSVREILSIGNDITSLKQVQLDVRNVHEMIEAQVTQVRQELEADTERLRGRLVATRRSLAEAAVRENQCRAVINDQREMVCRFLPNGSTTFVNAAFCTFFQVKQSQAIGSDFFHLIPEPQRRAFMDWALRDGEDPLSDTFQYALPRGNGEPVWLEWSCRAMRNHDGQIASLQAVGRDITPRRRAEEAVRKNEQRFRAIFDEADDIMFLKDGHLRISLVNPATEMLLGIPASNILGRLEHEAFGQAFSSTQQELDQRVLDGEQIELERSRTVHDCSYRFIESHIPLKHATGEVEEICVIARNVTERTRIAPVTRAVQIQFASEAMQNLLAQAYRVAKTDGLVVLSGESGTGKDWLARIIHNHSERSDYPFFAVNCAALPDDLVESELFGHEAGAFTGAKHRKRGLLELAEGGTLLLNEIGELPTTLQSKLLTFLDTRSFLRVGGQKSVRVNARILAATHRNLEQEVEEGRFLEPLYYRLSVFMLRLPPLRERREDIPELTKHLMSVIAGDLQLCEVPKLTPRDLDILQSYHWPGNVRELRNVLERSVILWEGGPFTLDIPPGPGSDSDGKSNSSFRLMPMGEAIEDLRRNLCVGALHQCNGNKREAAKLLGISRDALYRYIRRYELG
jgi:PAS domain S-box-containing protein